MFVFFFLFIYINKDCVGATRLCQRHPGHFFTENSVLFLLFKRNKLIWRLRDPVNPPLSLYLKGKGKATRGALLGPPAKHFVWHFYMQRSMRRTKPNFPLTFCHRFGNGVLCRRSFMGENCISPYVSHAKLIQPSFHWKDPILTALLGGNSICYSPFCLRKALIQSVNRTLSFHLHNFQLNMSFKPLYSESLIL